MSPTLSLSSTSTPKSTSSEAAASSSTMGNCLNSTSSQKSLPIDTPFNFPSPLPTWPSGEEMVSTRAKASSRLAEEASSSRQGNTSKIQRKFEIVCGRCYPVHLHNTMIVNEALKTEGSYTTAGPALRDVMSMEQMTLLSTTPFVSYLDLPPLKQDLVLVDSLLGVWDDEKRGVIIGQTCIPLIADEIAVLVGLPTQGEPIDWGQKGVKSKIFDKYFNGDCKKADRRKLRHILYSLAGQQGEDVASDFVSVFILYVFATVLFPTSHYSIPKVLYRYIDDVTRIGDYAWGHAVYNFLVSSISKASGRVKRRNSGQERNGGYIDGCTVAFMSWAFEHIMGLGRSDGDKAVPRMRKWKGSVAFRSYDKLKKQMLSYSPSEVIPTFTYRPEEMYILNRSARVGQPPQIQSATPVASTSSAGDSRSFRTLFSDLEQAYIALEERNKFLEAENLMLKDLIKKHQYPIFTGAGVAAGEGAVEAVVEKQQVEDAAEGEAEGGHHNLVEEPSQHPVDAGQINIVVPTTDSRTDIPSRIERIKGRERKRKLLSHDFTAGKGYNTRKRLRDSKDQVPTKTETSDSASGDIADILKAINIDFNDPEGGVSSINVPDEPALDSSLGIFTEHRRDYLGRAKIPKEEDDAINFSISQPITKGAIWEDSTKGSDLPSVSGEILCNFLFGGPTRDEVIDVYFHILTKLDLEGVQKFTHPALFCRSEVSMHILNKMSAIRPGDAITADFIRHVAYDSASVRHFLKIISAESIRRNRYIIIPVNSNWHWHLLVIDLKESRFESWNSLWSHHMAKDAANLLAKWFASYFEFILEQRIGHPNIIWQHDCQQQGSTEVDCGMYTCLFAERIVRGGSPDLLVYENHPVYFRAHIVSQMLRDPCCVTSSSMRAI